MMRSISPRCDRENVSAVTGPGVETVGFWVWLPPGRTAKRRNAPAAATTTNAADATKRILTLIRLVLSPQLGRRGHLGAHNVVGLHPAWRPNGKSRLGPGGKLACGLHVAARKGCLGGG